MDTFVKLASVDIDGRCNVVKPFKYEDINRQLNPTTGRINTPSDIDTAWKTWMKITFSKKATAIPCCDPELRESEVSQSVMAKIRAQFPLYREIIKNGEIAQIQLSRTTRTGPTAATWKPITPYIVCKISNALSIFDKAVKQDTQDKAMYVIDKADLLLNCYSQDCPKDDIITVDNLFDSARKNVNYTWLDDSQVIRAITDGDTEALSKYLFKYNNVNQILTNDDYNNRLIHIATQYYKPKIFDMIMAVRPNLNVKNAEGNTPLHFAAKYGSTNALDDLIRAGVEMNPKNNLGETPIMLAARYTPPMIDPKTKKPQPDTGLNLAMVRLLYNNGASVLDVDNQGNNMLHNIILNAPNNDEKSSLVRFALERGTRADQVNKAGKTPLMLIDGKIKESGAVVPVKSIINSLDLTENAASAVRNISNTIKRSIKGVTEGFQVVERVPDELTAEQRELLEIQTLLFNDIVRSNPEKYGGYISVADIPKGAPVEVLDYMCTGDSSEIQGIESKAECLEKGGQYLKIKNPSTLVKLELIPESEMAIDKTRQEDVYYLKQSEPTTIDSLPSEIAELNKIVRAAKPTITEYQIPTTTMASLTMPTATDPTMESSSNKGSKEGFITMCRTVESSRDLYNAREPGLLADKRLITDLNNEYKGRPDVPVASPRIFPVKLHTESELLGLSPGSLAEQFPINHPTEKNKYMIAELYAQAADLALHPAELSPVITNAAAVLALNNSMDKTIMGRIKQNRLARFTMDNKYMLVTLVLLIILFVWYLRTKF